jgi:TPR repeat protein/predicted acylesterase/phospholipase RssA
MIRPAHRAIRSATDIFTSSTPPSSLFRHRSTLSAQSQRPASSGIALLEQLIMKEMGSPQRSQAVEPEELLVRNLAFKGGGPKGLAYVAAVQALSDRLGGLDDIVRVSGASAGSIIATLLAVGYNSQEIGELLKEEVQGYPLLLRFMLDDVPDFGPEEEKTAEGSEKAAKDKEVAAHNEFLITLLNSASNATFPKITIPGILLSQPISTYKLLRKFYEQRGISNGEFFRTWINEKIRQKLIQKHIELYNITDESELQTLSEIYIHPTFGQLNGLLEKQSKQNLLQHQRSLKHLYVVVAKQVKNNTTSQIYTSETLTGIESAGWYYKERLIIADVVRASMSIPLAFSPAVLNLLDDKGRRLPLAEHAEEYAESTMIDGGVMDNYPVTLFDFNVFQTNPDPTLSPYTKVENTETIGLFLYDKADMPFFTWLKYIVPISRKAAFENEPYPEAWPSTYTLRSSAEAKIKLARHINIDNCGVGLLDFSLPIERQEELLDSGATAVEAFWVRSKSLLHAIQENQSRDNRKKLLDKLHDLKIKYTNLTDYPVIEDYVVPPQYMSLLKEVIESSGQQPKIVLHGFGGIGKTELGRYIADRYLEACFWAQWQSQKSEDLSPIIWVFDAETPSQMWRSLSTLAKSLAIKYPSIERNLNEEEDVWKKRCERVAEEFLSSVCKKIPPNRPVMWVFDNAELHKEERGYYYPEFHAYWSKLRVSANQSAWRLVTTRDNSLINLGHPLKINLEEGMGEKCAHEFFSKLLKARNPDVQESILPKLIKELDYLPLNLRLAAYYIYQEKITCEKYLDLHRTKKEYLDDELSDIAKIVSGNYRKTQIAVIKLSMEKLQEHYSGKEALKLLYFCHFLSSENISEDLLASFIRKMHVDWKEKEVSTSLKNQLEALKSYSLLSVNKTKNGKKSYRIHRLIQKSRLIEMNILPSRYSDKVVSALLDCHKDTTGKPLFFSKKLEPHYRIMHFALSVNSLKIRNNLSHELANRLSEVVAACFINQEANFHTLDEIEQNSAVNNLLLGIAYYHGVIVKKNLNKAIYYFASSAEQGNVNAQFNLGRCYLDGDGVEKNPRRAVQYFEVSAKQGDVGAQLGLGICYLQGDGVEKDTKKAIEYFKAAAEQGNMNAQFNLGVCYLHFEKDAKKSIQYFEAAARQGHMNAKFNLGVCYFQGDGVEKDIKKAIAYFDTPAKQGNMNAQFNLGVCYFHSDGVKDTKKAAQYFEDAAKQGDASAQFNLGVCYLQGNGVEKNIKKAIQYFKNAAKQGDSEAQFGLGKCYLDGVEEDVKKAMQYFEVAADQGNRKAELNLTAYSAYYSLYNSVQKYKKTPIEYYLDVNPIFKYTNPLKGSNKLPTEKKSPVHLLPNFESPTEQGDAKAYFKLGVRYSVGLGVEKNMKRAIEFFEAAAKKGIIAAQLNLGIAYLYGDGIEKNPEKAYEYFKAATNQGYSHAAGEMFASELIVVANREVVEMQLNLRTYCLLNDGIGKDVKKAVQYFEAAANQEDINAQLSLGKCYLHGDGVEKDAKKAVQYFEIAAKQGNAEAQFNLGICYLNGYGVEKNSKKSVQYFEAAANQGDINAKFSLSNCYLHGEGTKKNEKKALQYLEDAASHGHMNAQLSLGKFYLDGNGTEKDVKKAIQYFESAAKQGNSNAQYNLGKLYLQGYDVEKNMEQAVQYFQVAANQEDMNSQFSLGECYLQGYGVEKDLKKSFNFFEAAAIQGHVKAQVNLGLFYLNGNGVKKNTGKAIEYFEAAAEKGDIDAYLNLGKYYWKGDGFGKNIKKALEYFEAAAKQGNIEAQLKLGFSYLNGDGVEKDVKKSVQYLEVCAAQGNAEVQFILSTSYFADDDLAKDIKKFANQESAGMQLSLGFYYLHGYGGKKNIIKAAEYFKSAADQGNIKAQFSLGLCYLNGEGVEKNPKKAVYYFEIAANHDHVGAQNNLGACYLNGIGVEKNQKKAIEYFKLSTKKDHTDAQNNLGICYLKGVGVEKNQKKAIDYFKLAAEKGHTDAQNNLNMIFEVGPNQKNTEAEFNLGLSYLLGIGVEKDEKKAIEYFEMAAKQGNINAQLSLGKCYLDGYGVEKDVKKAVQYYETAANQGHAEARFVLGKCYLNGNGIEKDMKKAIQYFETAISQGIVEAQNELDKLSEFQNLSNQQLHTPTTYATEATEIGLFSQPKKVADSNKQVLNNKKETADTTPSNTVQP